MQAFVLAFVVILSPAPNAPGFYNVECVPGPFVGAHQVWYSGPEGDAPWDNAPFASAALAYCARTTARGARAQ